FKTPTIRPYSSVFLAAARTAVQLESVSTTEHSDVSRARPSRGSGSALMRSTTGSRRTSSPLYWKQTLDTHACHSEWFRRSAPGRSRQGWGCGCIFGTRVEVREEDLPSGKKHHAAR